MLKNNKESFNSKDTRFHQAPFHVGASVFNGIKWFKVQERVEHNQIGNKDILLICKSIRDDEEVTLNENDVRGIWKKVQ